MYYYIKALHIIFIVTWFSGLFYIVRLFVYNTEAEQKEEPEREILRRQFRIMMRRLWFGITWPSAILTLIFGVWLLFLYGSVPVWLLMKLVFVLLLYVYHFSVHHILRRQLSGEFKYSSQQLRLWNEVATVLLVAIVMLVVVKQEISLLWGMIGLILFIIVLMSAVRIYKIFRRSRRSEAEKPGSSL